MASIIKEVTSGTGSYGPWHAFYKRQLEASAAAAQDDGLGTDLPSPKSAPALNTDPTAPVALGGSGSEDDMAYNNYYQRLRSGGVEQTHMVGQSLSPHRMADPGPPIEPAAEAPLPPATSASRPPTRALSQMGAPNVFPGGRPETAVGTAQQEPLPKKIVAFNVPPIPMEDNHTVDPGEPMVRAGRLGAPWRHIRQCTGNGGNHICFVDGVVKQNDMSAYPPYGYASPHPVQMDDNLANRHLSAPTSKSMPSGMTKYNNSFNNHAKSGFKYWFEEKKGLPGAKQTIGGRLMKMGVGY